MMGKPLTMEREFKVRFHLGKGANYLKWRVENLDTGVVEFFYPIDYGLSLDNCKLYNQTGAANKIFEGENKTVCAWIMAENVRIITPSNVCKIDKNSISYNPRKKPYWVDAGGNNVDKKQYDYLETQGRQLYIS